VDICNINYMYTITFNIGKKNFTFSNVKLTKSIKCCVGKL